MVHRRRSVWALLFLAGTAAEIRSLHRRDDATLSETLRAVYRTHTPLGRALLIASWAAFTCWFVPHLCRVVIKETS
jgi:hypothetical protein